MSTWVFSLFPHLQRRSSKSIIFVHYNYFFIIIYPNYKFYDLNDTTWIAINIKQVLFLRCDISPTQTHVKPQKNSRKKPRSDIICPKWSKTFWIFKWAFLFTVTYYSYSENQKGHTILTFAVQVVCWWKGTDYISPYLCWVQRKSSLRF